MVLAASGLTLTEPLSTVRATQATLNWINWTDPASFPLSGSLPQPGYAPYAFNYATEALGTITMPDTSTIYVKFSGEVARTGAGFSHPSDFGVAGSSYWSSRLFTSSGSAYISSNVPSLPTNGDRIGVVGSSVAQQSLSFYSDIARTFPVNVSNIVMNIYSLGGPDFPGAWDFNQVFSVISDNRSVHPTFGFSKSTPVVGTTRLAASEGSGTIQFNGTFDTISWTVTQPEAFATWNIGVTSANPPLDVTFDTQGGSAVATQTTTIGGSLTNPGTPTRAGYAFAGWFVAGSGGTPITFPYAHGRNTGFTLFAQWTAGSTTTTTDPATTTTTVSSSTPVTATVDSPARTESQPPALPSTGISPQVPLLAGGALLILGVALTLRRRLA